MADDKDIKDLEENTSLDDDGTEATSDQGPTESESSQTVSADALSRDPNEDTNEQPASSGADGEQNTPLTNVATATTAEASKKPSALKNFFRKVNLYFLFFILVIIVAGVITVVYYLNSTSTPPEANIASQELTEQALQQLANTDASVGNTSQTLTIQGNAVVAGQTLMRGELNVASSIQTGGSIQGPTLSISGASNLNDVQINTLQIAGATTIQGETTLQGLNVAGVSSFSGPLTASQITVTRLVISGNGSLEVPNHISFTGSTPSRSLNSSVIGGGGSASINGSDTAGTINLNTGNNPTPGCLVDVTFNQAFGRQPRVIVSPIGYAAGQMQYYVTRTQSSFSLCSVNAPAANQSLSFDYFVTN